MPATLQILILLTLSNVFMMFAVLYMKVELKRDFLWAALCLVGAVYFMFRSYPWNSHRDRGRSILTAPLPHHPACGSAPGGSRS